MDKMNRRKKRIRHIRVLLISMILILLLLAAVPFPIKISRTLDGIRWQGSGGQQPETCQVTVDGWYYRYLLKGNIFKGDISFVTAEETVSYSAPNITLHRDTMYRDRGGSATVYDAALNRMRTLGYLAVAGNFKEIFISSKEWNYAAPAENLEEALELAGKLTTEEWY